MSKVKYPEIEVQLSGNDGNAFAIMGNTQKALRRGGIPQEEIKKYLDEAMAGDYDNLVQVTMRWVNVS